MGGTPDADYLASTIGQPLSLAVAEVCIIQPADPIEWLSGWLYKYVESAEWLKAYKKEKWEKSLVEVQSKRTESITAQRDAQQVALRISSCNYLATLKDDPYNLWKNAIKAIQTFTDASAVYIAAVSEPVWDPKPEAAEGEEADEEMGTELTESEGEEDEEKDEDEDKPYDSEEEERIAEEERKAEEEAEAAAVAAAADAAAEAAAEAAAAEESEIEGTETETDAESEAESTEIGSKKTEKSESAEGESLAEGEPGAERVKVEKPLEKPPKLPKPIKYKKMICKYMAASPNNLFMYNKELKRKLAPLTFEAMEKGLTELHIPNVLYRKGVYFFGGIPRLGAYYCAPITLPGTMSYPPRVVGLVCADTLKCETGGSGEPFKESEIAFMRDVAKSLAYSMNEDLLMGIKDIDTTTPSLITKIKEKFKEIKLNHRKTVKKVAKELVRAQKAKAEAEREKKREKKRQAKEEAKKKREETRESRKKEREAKRKEKMDEGVEVTEEEEEEPEEPEEEEEEEPEEEEPLEEEEPDEEEDKEREEIDSDAETEGDTKTETGTAVGESEEEEEEEFEEPESDPEDWGEEPKEESEEGGEGQISETERTETDDEKTETEEMEEDIEGEETDAETEASEPDNEETDMASEASGEETEGTQSEDEEPKVIDPEVEKKKAKAKEKKLKEEERKKLAKEGAKKIKDKQKEVKKLEKELEKAEDSLKEKNILMEKLEISMSKGDVIVKHHQLLVSTVMDHMLELQDTELKRLKCTSFPRRRMYRVLKALLYLLGYKKHVIDDWIGARDLIHSEFITALKNYDTLKPADPISWKAADSYIDGLTGKKLMKEAPFAYLGLKWMLRVKKLSKACAHFLDIKTRFEAQSKAMAAADLTKIMCQVHLKVVQDELKKLEDDENKRLAKVAEEKRKETDKEVALKAIEDVEEAARVAAAEAAESSEAEMSEGGETEGTDTETEPEEE